MEVAEVNGICGKLIQLVASQTGTHVYAQIGGAEMSVWRIVRNGPGRLAGHQLNSQVS